MKLNTSNMKVRTLRLDDELWRKCCNQAELEQIHASQFVRRVLTEYFDQNSQITLQDIAIAESELVLKKARLARAVAENGSSPVSVDTPLPKTVHDANLEADMKAEAEAG